MKMSMLSSALNWYQKKIGAYDKQMWEKNLDRQILRGMSAVPKKLARIKTELIDIDLVRGSAFTKAKPQHSWISATLSGLVRVLFLPFYFKWWKLQTNALVSLVLILLYTLQILSMIIFYSSSEEDFSDVQTSEVLTPIAMLLILGILHSQIVATFSIKSSRKRVATAKRKRLKRKLRTRDCVSYDTKSSHETASDGRTNVQKNSHHSSRNCDYNRASKDLKENGVCKSLIPVNSHKKCSDEESGLDLMDSVIFEDKEKYKSQSNYTLRNRNSSKHCPINTGQLYKTSSSKSVENNQKEPENISSDEEYFVAKRPVEPKKQEWQDFIVNLNPIATVRKTSSFKQSHIKNKCRELLRCSSDTELISDHNVKVKAKSRSDNNVLSCLIPPRPDEPKKTTLIANGTCWDYNPDSKFRKRFAHKKTLPLNMEKPYSSGDSAPDTTSPNTPSKRQTSDLEWPLITNTDCNSDSSSDSTSESSHNDEADASTCENPFAWEIQETSALSVNVGCPSSDKGPQTRKVSCTIWERNECQKADLSVLDISSVIIRKVDSSVSCDDYLAIGLVFSCILALLPLLFRLQSDASIHTIQDVTLDVINFTVPSGDYMIQMCADIIEVTLGSEWRVKTVVLIALTERFVLSLAYFFLLSVAEKTFKQRFLYAKHFSYLTSSRRARKTYLPHFRLNKVRNIKTWLSVRSYLKKLGPQRSVDVIVSVAFILEVCVLSFLCVQLLKETGQFSSKLQSWETIFWTLALGFYLLRFMIIGSKINKKYRNRSVLITEQINLYLHMEQKPHKKEELMLANSVLKLAADLLKELESPFKISGLCANPYLYNFTKVVVLSAFSAVLTEVLGFKLKLYKIKLQ